jgi:hypothetical protein
LLPLQREARRVVGALPGKRTPLRETLASLASIRPGKNTTTLLKLPPQTILIVPRLGALATIEQFVQDVRTRVSGANAEVEWLASPR